jgi:F-type H+-transporting ATPase subunit delta
MPGGVSARRYAQAIFELAIEYNDIDAWNERLERLRRLVAEPDVIIYLESSQVPLPNKRMVLDQLLGKAHLFSVNLVLLLANRGNLRSIPAIADEFARLESEYLGITKAQVITAVSLTEAETNAVREHLASVTGKKVIIEPFVEPEILGGIIVKVGDKLIDGSVQNRLRALRKTLV